MRRERTRIKPRSWAWSSLGSREIPKTRERKKNVIVAISWRLLVVGGVARGRDTGTLLTAVAVLGRVTAAARRLLPRARRSPAGIMRDGRRDHRHPHSPSRHFSVPRRAHVIFYSYRVISRTIGKCSNAKYIDKTPRNLSEEQIKAEKKIVFLELKYLYYV